VIARVFAPGERDHPRIAVHSQHGPAADLADLVADDAAAAAQVEYFIAPGQIDAAIEKTLGNVRERVRKFGGEPAGSLFAGGAVLLTDDGLASGYTMMAAIRATRRMRPAEVIVAVPTASDSAVRKIAPLCDRIVCLNIRSGSSFAVASAYREWHDLSDEETYSLLSGARKEGLIPDKY